ncbi:hypothetical protein EES39_38935 [Streptomyces sp. ADI92-24]|uniref:hypothetical protein n=1 Tax=Streptomyces sp. ADI92-24 TaxID=1522756 RepID=UPI000FB7FCF5|nr:hypothetical protein [Streptomyces sp. ADI92-24]RPK32467.1 hypothetical protein EES39_38935 [Streptomyces sp. ADI92-24]
MSRRWKIPAMVVGGVLIVSTPFFWLLDNPDTGQLVAASVQGLTGVAALIPALFRSPAAPESGAANTAADTGDAKATAGGKASTGIRGTQGAGSGSAKAERTGNAVAEGSGSSANTGVDYS